MESIQDELKRLNREYGGGSGNAEKHKRVPLKYSVKDEVMRRQRGRCARCNVNFITKGIRIHIDHKKPVSKGGSNGIRNLQALCPNCHANKHHKENVKDAREPKNSNEGFGFEIPKSISGFKPPKLPRFK